MTVPWYFFVRVVILCYGKIMVSDAKNNSTSKNTMILKLCVMLFASLILPWYFVHVPWCFWKKLSIKTIHDFLYYGIFQSTAVLLHHTTILLYLHHLQKSVRANILKMYHSINSVLIIELTPWYKNLIPRYFKKS